MTDLKVMITRDELARLPLRNYGGPVCLVSTSDDVERAREDFRHERIVGVDTETPPAFRVGQNHLPSLVQVASSRAVYLFQLKQDLGLFDGVLTELLENPSVVKAGIGLSDDFKKLKMRFPFTESNALDLATVVRKQKLAQTGVRNLAGIFLDFRVAKGQKTSNWGRQDLTRNQILYAATDAWVCRELYLCFQERGFLKGHA